MVDIKKAEEEFIRYVSNYDITQKPIERKKFHSLRVEKICEEIAILLGLDEEKINLAKLIGLLHDIARFEQYTIYGTYDDVSSIDHGDLAIEILKKNDYIRKYIETDKYDDIILKAIKYHNKYAIGKDVNKEEELFCKIIRDADKLDIFYIAIDDLWKDEKEEIEKQIISPKVLEQFISNNVVNKQYIKNNIDTVIIILAFIYDLNFKSSYEIIKQNKYIDKIIDRFDFKEENRKQMEYIRKVANEYINKKLKEE